MVYWCSFEVLVPLESQIAPLTGLGEVCSVYPCLQRAMVLLIHWDQALLLEFILKRIS